MKNINTNIKKLTAALLALTLVLGLAACTKAQAYSNMDGITVERAKEAVLDHMEATEISITELDTNRDDNRYEFEILADGVEYEVDVNASTGQIIQIHQEEDVPKASAQEATPVAPVETAPSGLTADEAKALVQEQLGSTDAKFVEQEKDDGAYEFEVISDNNKYEVEVNASTGKIKVTDKETIKKAPAKNEPVETAPPATEPPVTVPVETAPPALTMDEAKALVLSYLGDADAKFIAQETEQDDDEYEFEVISGDTEYDIEVNIYSGKVKVTDKETIKKAPAKNEPMETAPPATEPPETVPVETAPTALTLDEAKALVLSYLGDANAKFTEQDKDDGNYEFEVIANNAKYEIEVSIKTGKIRETDREYLSTAKTITKDEAKALVLAHLGDSGATFTDTELEDGIYEFEVRSNGAEYNYKVDAVTGKILKAKLDD